MVEQVLEDTQDLFPIVEVRGEPVDVYHNIDDRNAGQLVHVLVQKRTNRLVDRLLQLNCLTIFFHIYLALNNFIYFLEHRLLRHSIVLFVTTLNNVVHSIQVL